MTDYVKYFLENDPLKTTLEVVNSANFGDRSRDSEATVSLFFLFWTSVFLALSKTLYGDAGFTFLQHFWTTLFIVLIGYIVFGVLITIGRAAWTRNYDYAWVNNKLRCFLTCFLATIAVSLVLVFFADPITRAAVWLLELIGIPMGYVGGAADYTPALLFSLIGCAAVFVTKAEKSHGIRWTQFPSYWVLTAFVFYELAFERSWFFDHVMRYSFKIVPS